MYNQRAMFNYRKSGKYSDNVSMLVFYTCSMDSSVSAREKPHTSVWRWTVPAVRAMGNQDQGAAVAAGVAAAATVAEASPLAAAEDPRSTRRAIAVPALAPKPALGALEPFVFRLYTNPMFYFHPCFMRPWSSYECVCPFILFFLSLHWLFLNMHF